MALSDYQGETIIDSITIKQGKKHFNNLWMPRTVFNDPHGKDAFIIGNGESRIGFDLYSLPQDTYGCNALYRDYEPDYLIVVDQMMYKEILQNEYDQKNTVYTNRNNIKKHGGSTNLIPNNPHKGAGTTAMHIAIHDGHTRLFCIGFDCAEDGPNINVYKDTPCYDKAKSIANLSLWGKQIYTLALDHPDVSFVFVDGNLPSDLMYLANCSTISYGQLNTHINTSNETA